MRYERLKADRGTSGTPVFHKHILPLCDLMAANMRADIDTWMEANKQRRGAHVWGPILAPLPLEEVAAMALEVMVDCDQNTKAIEIARMLGQATERQWQYIKTAEEDPRVLEDIQYLKRKLTGKKKTMINRLLRQIGRWDETVRFQVGSFLLDHLVHTGLWFRTTNWVKSGKKVKQDLVISWDAEAIEFINQLHEHEAHTRPLLPHMIVPPLPNVEGEKGGYLELKVPLIKRQEWRYTSQVNLNSAAVRSLNVMQNTGYIADGWTLDHMKRYFKENHCIGKLVSTSFEPEPKPDTTDESILRQWRKEQREAYAEYYADTSRRIHAHRTMSAATQVLGDPFWLPLQFDSRGRVYPAGSPYLHPQSSDVTKSLLRFAEPVHQTDEGYRWLLIQAANCAGLDKVSFADRVAWAEQHIHDIRETGRDPDLTFDWWTEMDDPWQFLVTCREIHQYHEGNPLTNLPVNVDGATNALQHYAALGLDPEAASAVGLEPSLVPADTYTRVLRVVQAAASQTASQGLSEQALINRENALEHDLALLETTLIEGVIDRTEYRESRRKLIHEKHKMTPEMRKAMDQRIARYWLPILMDPKRGRKHVKRNAMTYAYGLTEYGARDQIIKEYGEGAPRPVLYGGWLGSLVYKCIPEVVSSAAVYMEWFQQCALVCNQADRPIEWTTPAGFKAKQEYAILEKRRLNTVFAEWSLVDPNAEIKLNKRKQKGAIAPNVIHSFDAAHMQLTVLAGVQRGIDNWFMIHDSYGCPGPQVNIMRECLAEQFVDMYSHNLLDLWKNEVEMNAGVVLPMYPERGTFDINRVLQSEYFFH